MGDLDGLATGEKRTWAATVSTLVLDDAEAAFAGATVAGMWSTGTASSCTTGGNGRCSVTLGGIRSRTESVTFTVGTVTAPARAYDAGANADPDGDSTGTSIVVRGP